MSNNEIVMIKGNDRWSDNMKIGVIGGGAIGLLISSYLSKQHEVTIYVRRRSQYEKINKSGVNLFDCNELLLNANLKVAFLEKNIKQDLLLVTVKQHHVNDVIDTIPPEIPTVFLQNGMGHVELLQKRYNSYVGIVEHGAYRKYDDTVLHLGKGKITIISVTGSNNIVEYLVSELHHNLFPFYKKENWELSLKEKLIVNAVINPLTALFDVPNEAIIVNSKIKRLAKQLHSEAAKTLNLDENYYWTKVKQVAKNTGKNTSSMRSDIKYGRKTELDAITGYILKQSKGSLPYHQFIYDAILAIEERNKNG